MLALAEHQRIGIGIETRKRVRRLKVFEAAVQPRSCVHIHFCLLQTLNGLSYCMNCWITSSPRVAIDPHKVVSTQTKRSLRRDLVHHPIDLIAHHVKH